MSESSWRARHASLLVAGVLLLATNLFSQTAQITGRVTDATGAVVPGASITVLNVATGVDRKLTTNEGGYYNVPLLQPGEYRVTLEQQGFKTVVRSGVVLEVDQRAELNFALEVGAVAEHVEVRAAAAQLNTVEASQGQVIENQRIVELPLNGRNYDDLALLSAGAVQAVGGSRYEGFSSGGMRNTQNNFILDGVDNNPVELAGAQRRSEMVQPSIDAIQEFKVQTNAYAAEYGRAMGSVVNVTTKSGTNELHGTAFEFLRNEKLDAKNFFDPPDRAKPPFKRNQYGFALGGPVYIPRVFDGRNKVFFFGDYEASRRRESSTTSSTIPTLRMRNGDFGELLAQRNLAITDPVSGSPFPGNMIPASRLDPLALTLMKLYPDPQNATVVTNYIFQAPRKEDVDRFDARADVNMGVKDNLFWRISHHGSNSPAVLNLPRAGVRRRRLRLDDRGHQHRRHMEPHLDAELHHLRPRRVELRSLQEGQSRRVPRRAAQPEVRHQGRQRYAAGRLHADGHYRLPRAGHRPQQPGGPRLAEPPACGRRHLDARQARRQVRPEHPALPEQHLQHPQRTRPIPVQRPLHAGTARPTSCSAWPASTPGAAACKWTCEAGTRATTFRTTGKSRRTSPSTSARATSWCCRSSTSATATASSIPGPTRPTPGSFTPARKARTATTAPCSPPTRTTSCRGSASPTSSGANPWCAAATASSTATWSPTAIPST